MAFFGLLSALSTVFLSFVEECHVSVIHRIFQASMAIGMMN